MTIDAAARLAAGRPSVANTQTYVSACQALGYQHPDLTAHRAQILEWFGGEDGLDLAVLDADCALLRVAAAAADEAVSISRDGVAALAAGWIGESGAAATAFIERHCASGVTVAAALRAAAQACDVLRDDVGRLVEEKVRAAVTIDDRHAGDRPAWLAAAAAVTGGHAEQTEAVEIVTHQITPYVDADIRTDWLTAMRSATASVTAAYEDALRQLNAFPPTHFDIPGPWGPESAAVALPAALPLAAPTVPAATAPVVPPDSAPVLPAPPATDTAPAQPLPPAPPPEPAALPGPVGTAPAGMPTMPDVGGGLSGLAGQLADAFGGLSDGMPEAALDEDPPELDDPALDSEADEDHPEPEEADGPEEASAEEDPVTAETPADVEQPAGESPAPEAVPTETEPPPPEPGPPPPAVEQSDERTPCEIAADELPQVGQ